MHSKITLDDFLKKAVEKHRNMFVYDKVKDIVNNTSKIIITCRIHGDFIQTVKDHRRGCGCPKCGYIKVSNSLSMTHEEFIKLANLAHNNKFDYSKVTYKNLRTKINIICPVHGEFWQIPESHINGIGCRKCSGCFKNSTEDFIKKARHRHGDKFDYSLVIYRGARLKVDIKCREHGVFSQAPSSHLQGNGCPICNKLRLIDNNPNKKTTDEFVAQAIKIHGSLYNYSKTLYELDGKPVTITCKKHGDFKQIANYHISGNGCPICSYSTGERAIKIFLEKNNIKYEAQKKFMDCRDKLRLPFDFYIPIQNICIEYNGEQHYRPFKIFGG